MLLYKLIDLQQKLELCGTDKTLITVRKGRNDNGIPNKEDEIAQMIQSYKEIVSQLPKS